MRNFSRLSYNCHLHCCYCVFHQFALVSQVRQVVISHLIVTKHVSRKSIDLPTHTETFSVSHVYININSHSHIYIYTHIHTYSFTQHAWREDRNQKWTKEIRDGRKEANNFLEEFRKIGGPKPRIKRIDSVFVFVCVFYTLLFNLLSLLTIVCLQNFVNNFPSFQMSESFTSLVTYLQCKIKSLPPVHN